MKTETRWKIILGAAAGVIAGAVGGFFVAHMMMDDMAGMQSQRMKDTSMKGMDMKGMQPAPATTPAVVAIPAGTRQLIGVRSAPAIVGTLEQEIRTVGTVDYDERAFTQVNLRAFETESGNGEAQRFVRLVEDSLSRGESRIQVAAHSHRLRALPGKYVGCFAHLCTLTRELSF